MKPLVETIKQLQEEGFSLKEIAKHFNCSNTTIKHVLNPESKKRAEENRKRKYHSVLKFDPYFKEHGRQKPLTNEQEKERLFIRRCKAALKSSRQYSRRNGWTKCSATINELKEAFTGKCHICEVNEKDRTRKLCMDHCHKTGNFRGWLCDHCNLGLGYMEDYIIEVTSYLNSNNGKDQ